MVGSVSAASRFEDTRRNLEENLSNVVERILKDDDNEERDKIRLFASLQQLGFVFSSMQAGAICSGLGAYFQLLDTMSGFVGFSIFTGVGGAVYVAGTSRARTQFQQTWNQRAERMQSALEHISEKELERVNRRILEGVAPYTRYVESEKERIANLLEQCERIVSAGRTLRNRISKL